MRLRGLDAAIGNIARSDRDAVLAGDVDDIAGEPLLADAPREPWTQSTSTAAPVIGSSRSLRMAGSAWR
jgi:hypothetical protein